MLKKEVEIFMIIEKKMITDVESYLYEEWGEFKRAV